MNLIPFQQISCILMIFILPYNLIAEKLDTFIVYNHRRKVTSSAKKKRKPSDMSLHQVHLYFQLILHVQTLYSVYFESLLNRYIELCVCRLQMVHYLTLYEMRMIFFHIVISSSLRYYILTFILVSFLLNISIHIMYR